MLNLKKQRKISNRIQLQFFFSKKNPGFLLAKPQGKVPFSWHFWGGSVGRHRWETLQIKNGLDLVLSAEPDI
jgi:hypothetical protein